MAFWRRIWQRDGQEALAACTALDVGTEFAKALVFDIDEAGHGTVRGVGRKRQGLSHMQSGTVADIAAVVDNCAVALQEAEEMAGFRPTQVVIGIAGELVKGFTTTHSQERKKPNQPISESELQKLIDIVQREALQEAERAITWETGLPHVDVRLVHAAVTGASIDGYALTNPVGFQGRHVKIGIFNAFAPLVHLGALQSVASQLDLELLEIVAEPYAVARVLGSDQSARPGRCSSTSAAGPRTSPWCARAASRAPACSPSAGGRSRRAWPIAWTCRSRGPRRSRSTTRGASRSTDATRSRKIVGDDVRVWAAGVELVMEELSEGDLLPGPHLPVRRRVAAPRDPGGAGRRVVLEAPAVRPTARDHRDGARPGRDDLGRHEPARRPAGRHARSAWPTRRSSSRRPRTPSTSPCAASSGR